MKDAKQAFNFASHFLFDLGRSIGLSDYSHLYSVVANEHPFDALTMLVVNFACTGWGTMEILTCSDKSQLEKNNHFA